MRQAFDLQGKTAVVTGGTRGIGKAIAIGLAESGADIVLLQRSDDTVTQHEIRELGVRCEIVRCDMENIDEVKEAIPKAIEMMDSVDILVNNAGIQRRAPAAEFPEQDWDDVIKVNLKAVWILCQQAGKHMLEKKSGKIINIASIASFQGGLYVPAYAAAKGAVGQLTKALANEWSSSGINVNAIVPGYIATEMNTALIDDPVRSRQILERIPAGRWGNPDDFKGAAVFLASAAANYVHGHLLSVDGGWLGR
ncbi:2-deoxy-D-gluconate 3-dehydrogenase [Bacillus xiamenensis]|uniref:2-deoxy-D-gluconate 3-dehydrogenase n=1 Tax=Bacillus xiamenensis TaxID=1178537 RepID=A0AAC9NC41_9BACI|nr:MULTISPECIES: glucose 1-dehydrogenase [Bacillus]AOZ88508.1 2-deoxy-D-gluconate 3-dehydrogenase [Bacillus xiamenensis]EKF34061.1 2-deoxy-D-gluconate 3-dehydrogenase [Bacillus xiamenensis]MBG9910106.1 3-ketoacyl-ACP reductase [Bacillus xiamenensis]MCW1837221.1 glucose 1-dehydrogenase [Bacillus xiamenensis]MCY9575706.1 glucose 1-dehydrogenase [Bacillus xiamenensis]